jgi:AraC-like DNA-binding protein
MRMTPDPARGCLVIATTSARLSDHLRDYLGHPPAVPLRFHRDGSGIVPGDVTGQAWRHTCAMLDHLAGSDIHPMAARAIEESLLTAILLGLPHTATAQLADPAAPGPQPTGSAGEIREWLEAHHDQPVGITDLASAMGLSIRRVQAICRSHWNQTPMQLLRGIRLDHARKALLDTSPEPAATAGIAASAGFTRITRFNAAYQQRFGETPTQTLSANGTATRVAPSTRSGHQPPGEVPGPARQPGL